MKEEIKYNSRGVTQWMWRVLNRDNFKLGKNVSIGSFTVIDAQNGVTLEDDIQISMGCRILSHSHIDMKDGEIIMRKNSCLGANAVIMPDVIVGENSIIGALSFVKSGTRIPKNEIWAGIPAKFIKKIEGSEECYSN